MFFHNSIESCYTRDVGDSDIPPERVEVAARCSRGASSAPVEEGVPIAKEEHKKGGASRGALAERDLAIKEDKVKSWLQDIQERELEDELRELKIEKRDREIRKLPSMPSR